MKKESRKAGRKTAGITKLIFVKAKTLKTNPHNWRQHPEGQLAALQNVIHDREIGWAGALLFNEKTGRLIDGHARLNVVKPDDMVPVLVGSWSERAEKKILLTLDPISAMAEADEQALISLAEQVDLTHPDFIEMQRSLDEMLKSSEEKKNEKKDKESAVKLKERWMILIECENEQQQIDLLNSIEEKNGEKIVELLSRMKYKALIA